MKILHVSYADGGGGAAIAAYRLHCAMRSLGYDSQMLCIRAEQGDGHVSASSRSVGKMVNSIKNVMIRTFLRKLFGNISGSLNIFPSGLAKKINKMDANIVNLHWVNGEALSIREISKINKPVVWTLHDLWPMLGCSHYPIWKDEFFVSGYKRQGLFDLEYLTWKRKLKHWKKFKPTIVCVGTWLAECASKSKLLKENKINTIPNTLNLDIWKPVGKSIARTILNLPEGKTLILFGAIKGSQDLRKGFDLLCDALRIFNETVQSDTVELVIFGEKRPLIALDLPYSVHYLGHIHDEPLAAIAYSAADLVCVPSRQETFGQTASESMACGTPVVAFGCTGLLDIVDHKINGYLATAFDIDDFSNGIEWVLASKNPSSGEGFISYEQLSRNARIKVEETFSPEIVAKQYEEVYEMTLSSQTFS